MNCNKEEVARAKALAERKMLEKDFVGAKYMIIKVQRLSKEVDDIDIPRMLTVCDVHCAVGAKVNGEIDWYGILQVPVVADDALIKKQYHKLAHLLHPDKNKFGGAEAAFKLVGEANITLTDKSKLMMYDMKIRYNFRGGLARSPHQHLRRTAAAASSSTSVDLHDMQQPQQQASNSDRKEKVFHSVSNNGLGSNNDNASDDNEYYSFTDPKFFYFDQLRDVNQFRANQIWAIYDNQDCMPRFYERITKVKTTPNFVLHFVWLEFDPTNKVDEEWFCGGLPVACGLFKHGESETAKETAMFSRTICFEKSKTRNSYEIYPKKGEVWALFKGWDIGWISDADNHKNLNYQYEVVQVLSDLTTSTSILVMPLVKIKGYVSIFIQSREAAPYLISQGIPEGSLELDPAALPLNLEEAFPSVIPDVHVGCLTEYICAESEFSDFLERRVLQKFSPGQIWALYNDVDKFPNYYAYIQEVDLKNGKVQIRWLDVCPRGGEEKRLLQEERTIACGTFRMSNTNEVMTYTGTAAFSHSVEARSTGRKGEYKIIPHSGEIWAIYKNWRAGWTAHDFENCEYEQVEILGHTDTSIRVQHLRKVDGYRTIFMPYRAEGSVKTISKDEYPRFSHQIPFFHLTHEDGGKLRGYLELDPLSLPEESLSTDST
ncbi:unnamed protein product [Urochloa decumbens]|uniref:J domain-containing protein n=1 Tax=Urochloa decumbens TaxID=240449 RepID=A0ABC8XJB5_9POAL